jgi:hypothetical protein
MVHGMDIDLTNYKIINHCTEKYLQQFKRMLRWYEKFEELNKGRTHSKNSFFYEDYIFSFFLNCYHLKDWIINDHALNIPALLVEDFINKSQYLKISVDLCNGLKHLTLKNPRTRNGAKFGKRAIKLTVGEGPSIISLNFKIESDSQIFDAFEVAEKCIGEWKTFFKSNNLKFQ